ncbi:DNA primase [Bradyrhizobium sp. Pear77]|uniref:phage/plasmid primase, P4 family n=1 Tax=Bradyrhizobium altum TaxID=1571202 RepID=UPI001E39A891|nr:phage/plasmid primase, P4 family [Bradyrhizobium altum]MCC8956186.1 DNA primase [Bradyrhizobium altum]
MVITIDPSAPDGFLVYSHANDDPLNCKDYVREQLGMASWQKGYSSKPGVEYVYRTQAGTAHMKVTRLNGKGGKKQFIQHRCENNDWVIGTKGIDRVPYRLDEIAASPDKTIYFVEGEKDADRLAKEGLLATTAPEGASAQWKPELTQWFKGRRVVIVPDNDQPGRAHAVKVADAISRVAASVKIVELPNLPPKGDVSDWLDGGGTIDGLIALCESSTPMPANDNTALPAMDFGEPFRGVITEADVAARFVEFTLDRLRYDHSRGKWYHWNGHRWQEDDKQLVLNWAGQFARNASEGKDAKVQIASRRTSFARAVATMASCDPRLAVTASSWDRDSFKLGTPDGHVDLKTGQLLPPDRRAMITKSTRFSPSPTANCLTWIRFLKDATGNDEGLIRFLQQWCGYSLTGDIREHALIFVYGGGGNGKSVFLNTVSRIFGDYAVTAAMDTFTASRDSKHPTELAMLRGARLVTASETEEGRAWAEARIKQLTGGDLISARFMRQDFFTYSPQFKLTVVGNHRPVLRKVDDAMRRRFNIIPFVHKPEVPDPQLEAKLRTEAPGILRWMIEGCLDWQTHGLGQPNVVSAATEEYFDEQDLVSQWLEECCDVDRDNRLRKAQASALFNSFKAFALEAGEEPGTAKALSATLRQRGFERTRSNTGYWYVGIRVREPVFG